MGIPLVRHEAGGGHLEPALCQSVIRNQSGPSPFQIHVMTYEADRRLNLVPIDSRE